MKALKIFLSICFVSFLFSCSDNTENLVEKNDDIALRSNITAKDYQTLLEVVTSNLNHSTKSTGAVEMTEDEAREILMPFLEDGKQIQHSLMDIVDKDIAEVWNNMTETDLITLSFLVCSVNHNSVETKATTGERILACLGAATGVSEIYKIGTKGLVNAKTALQVVKAVGKRYLGYIGVAIMVADFTICIGAS